MLRVGGSPPQCGCPCWHCDGKESVSAVGRPVAQPEHEPALAEFEAAFSHLPSLGSLTLDRVWGCECLLPDLPRAASLRLLRIEPSTNWPLSRELDTVPPAAALDALLAAAPQLSVQLWVASAGDCGWLQRRKHLVGTVQLSRWAWLEFADLYSQAEWDSLARRVEEACDSEWDSTGGARQATV